MIKHPAKPREATLVEIDDRGADRPVPRAQGSGWLSFRYSYTEISASGSTARVKSKRATLENGKLTTESFEGECDRSVYDRNLSDAQRFVADQATLFWKALGAFLLPPRK